MHENGQSRQGTGALEKRRAQVNQMMAQRVRNRVNAAPPGDGARFSGAGLASPLVTQAAGT